MKRQIAALAAVVLLLGMGGTQTVLAAQRAMVSRLAAVEDPAEGIAGGETTGASALGAAATAASAWRSARTAFASDAAASSAVPAVDAAIAALRAEREPARMRRAANEVTGALAPLFAAAGDSIPAEVYRLDYLGRSLTLDVHDANWARAVRDAASLQQTWSSLRPRVVSRAHGIAAAAEYDGAAHAIGSGVRARDAARTSAAAARSGDAVDHIEKLYSL